MWKASLSRCPRTRSWSCPPSNAPGFDSQQGRLAAHLAAWRRHAVGAACQPVCSPPL
jgi:hypothetical protein